MNSLLAKLGIAIHEDLVPYVENGMKILLILVVAWVLMRLTRRLIAAFKRFAIHRVDDPEEAFATAYA